MSKVLALLSLLIISFCSHAQPEGSSDVFREEIKKFFAAIQPMRGNLYVSDKPKGIVSKETVKLFFPLDTLFTQADIDFIEKQAIQNKILLWDSSLIDQRILIKDSQTKSVERYISYSIPSFSLDYQTCIIFVDHNCNFDLCGEGHILILKKKNGIWEIVDGNMIWVS